MKTKEIKDLIEFINSSGLDEVNIETEEFKLAVKRTAGIQYQSAPQTVSYPAQNTNPPPTEGSPEKSLPRVEEPEDSKFVTIKSPMIGTFYKASSPDSDPFVQPGSQISKGQTVCIVEAMKLFNEIESDVSGKVVKILVEDASPVEYDQPLFLVDPS